MKYLHKFILFLAGSFITMPAFSQTDQPFDLYLLIGQSNMAGRGNITGDFTNEGSPQVFMLNKASQWVPARHPLHFDKPAVAGVGPGLSFGIEMAKAAPGHRIGLIPCAVGGTSIDVWKPGAYDSATHTHPYDDMLLRLQEAQKHGILKGIIWHQGESDSNPTRSEGYLKKLEELVALLRAAAGNDHLPFIAGEIGRYNVNNANINNQLSKLPQELKYTGVASSEGFIPKEDHIHFTSESADAFGVRFAEEMKKVQSKN